MERHEQIGLASALEASGWVGCRATLGTRDYQGPDLQGQDRSCELASANNMNELILKKTPSHCGYDWSPNDYVVLDADKIIGGFCYSHRAN